VLTGTLLTIAIAQAFLEGQGAMPGMLSTYLSCDACEDPRSKVRANRHV
jgi:hypothetical protein